MVDGTLLVSPRWKWVDLCDYQQYQSFSLDLNSKEIFVMRSRYSFAMFTVLTGVLLSILAFQASAQITDLGTISALGINNSSQVVAWQTQNNVTQGVVWDAGNLVPLPPLSSGNSAYPYAINDLGNVCGQANNESVKWLENSDGSYPTPTFVIGATSWAYGIDSSNDIVGRAVFSYNNTALAYERTGSGTLFYPCGDGTDGAISGAQAVNDQNHIVGFYIPASGGGSVGFYSDGVNEPTSTFFQYTGMTRTLPRSINDSDLTVGETSNSTSTRGFVWQYSSSGGSPVVLLPLLPTGSNDSAFSVNSDGTVVGWADYIPSGGTSLVRHAAMWTQHNGSYTVIDLNQYVPNNSGWVLTNATGINDQGQIVGVGTLNGASHSFLFSPGWHGIDISLGSGAPSTLTQFFSDMPLGTDTLSQGGQVVDAQFSGFFTIVQAWSGIGRNSYAIKQLTAAYAAKLQAGAYCLLDFRQVDQHKKPVREGDIQVREALRAVGPSGAPLGFMAIDVERTAFSGGYSNLPQGLLTNPPDPTAQAAAINRISLAINEVLAAGLTPIIYTTRGDGWPRITGNTTSFSQYGLWEANTNEGDDLSLPDVTTEVNGGPLGGWSQRAGKQYLIDSSSSPVTLADSTSGLTLEVDPDVFDQSAFSLSNPTFKYVLPLQLSYKTASRNDTSNISVTIGIKNPGTLDALSGKINKASLVVTATGQSFSATNLPITYSALAGMGSTTVTLSFSVPSSLTVQKATLSVAGIDGCMDAISLKKSIILP